MAIVDLAKTGVPDLSRGPACTVCRLLEDLPDDEATALVALLADPHWRYSSLSDALADEGHKVSQHTLARHARGKCSAGSKLR